MGLSWEAEFKGILSGGLMHKNKEEDPRLSEEPKQQVSRTELGIGSQRTGIKKQNQNVNLQAPVCVMAIALPHTGTACERLS